MSVIITGQEYLLKQSTSVIIKNNGFTRIAIPSFRIRVYGRYYSSSVPVTDGIDVSLDGVDYTASSKITRTELNDPTYNLLFTFTGQYTDIWVRPTDSDSDVMLGDTISQTPYGSVDNDYPYNYGEPYQYTIHNNGPISSSDVDLYFQIANRPPG